MACQLLLEHGYTVKATVRNLDDSKKTSHLLGLNGAKEKLSLFEAELLDEGSFDSVVDGCEGVFHTASPVILTSSDPKGELIDPAVKGTLNVLKSCAKVPSIKRVVVTSSITSVIFNGKPLMAGVMVDETWFSDPVFCENSKLWYVLSKTLAEEAAWKFAKETGMDLVTIHPGFVVGPVLQPTLSLTSEVVLNLINGIEVPVFNRFVDVRDVAYAHIQAFELPSANGRYCMVERVTQISEASKMLHELYPSLPLSKKYEYKPVEAMYQVSKEKAKSLCIDFIPLEVSLKDTIESLIEKSFLSIRDSSLVNTKNITGVSSPN